MFYLDYKSPLTDEEFLAKYPKGTKLSEVEPLDLLPKYQQMNKTAQDGNVTESGHLTTDVAFAYGTLDSYFNVYFDKKPSENYLSYFARAIPNSGNQAELFIYFNLRPKGEYLFTKHFIFNTPFNLEERYAEELLDSYVKERLNGRFLVSGWRLIQTEEIWEEYCSRIETMQNFKESDVIPVNLIDTEVIIEKGEIQSEARSKDAVFLNKEASYFQRFRFVNKRSGQFDDEQLKALSKYIQFLDCVVDVYIKECPDIDLMGAKVSKSEVVIEYSNNHLFKSSYFVSSLSYLETQRVLGILFGNVFKFNLSLDLSEHYTLKGKENVYITTKEQEQFRKVFLESPLLSDVDDLLIPASLLIQNLYRGGEVDRSSYPLDNLIHLNKEGEIVFRSDDFLRGLRILLGAFPELTTVFFVNCFSGMNQLRLKFMHQGDKFEITERKQHRQFVVDRINNFINTHLTNG